MLHYLITGIVGLISNLKGITQLCLTENTINGLLNGIPLNIKIEDTLDKIKVSLTVGRITRFLTHDSELELLEQTSLTLDRLLTN